MFLNCAAVVLCGGRNSRMQARNKAFLTINGQRFLDRILAVLRPRFGEILLTAKIAAPYAQYGLKVVTDHFKVSSSLAGVHAGLSGIQANHAFCVGCDTPLLKPAVVDILLKALDNQLDDQADIVLPASGDYFQPLCAVYAKSCLGMIETHLAQNQLQINRLFGKLRLKKIPYPNFETVDPELVSFFNINTPEDLRQAAALAKSQRDTFSSGTPTP